MARNKQKIKESRKKQFYSFLKKGIKLKQIFGAFGACKFLNGKSRNKLMTTKQFFKWRRKKFKTITAKKADKKMVV